MKGWQWTVRVALAGILAMLLWGQTNMVLAASGPAAAPTPLTLEELQQRVQVPVQREGKPTLDLRRVMLDLRPENGEFRDRFYRLVQHQLQGGGTAVNLDLSQSVVLGEFDLQRLSLREPLYGEALFPLLSEPAQEQLRRDRRRLSQLSQLSRSLLLQPQPTALGIFLFRGSILLDQTRFEGNVNGADIFFLGNISAQGTRFAQATTFIDSRFSRSANFLASQFGQAARFRNAMFFDRARFGQSNFQGEAVFQGAEFQRSASFGQTVFAAEANFSRSQFRDTADFSQTLWQGEASLLRARFLADCFFTDARIESPMTLRQARFSRPVNWRGATVLASVDFGDAVFDADAYLNVAGLEFNAAQAQILGSPGQIGRVLSVPTLAGNETLLRNLVRNFRQLEQVADANRVEYLTERLRLQALSKQLTAVNLNTASRSQLQRVGFSAAQVSALLDRRRDRPFVSAADVLNLDGIDLAVYVKVRDRIVAQPPLTKVSRIPLAARWLGLAALLVMSHYGTSVGLVLGTGVVAIALSSLLFWTVDRVRRRLPTPILPPWAEMGWMLGSAAGLLAIGVSAIARLGDTPQWTLLAISLLVIPVPAALMAQLYRTGRYHNQLDTSYLVEDGSARQLRLLIARLPIIPSFPFFRERFTPIQWGRRRNWLNYYDFSLNNWFKFGFNDIRLRDEEVPGWVTALVWYQWAIGLAYVALLLWTLSRTIPGLNLLLYF